MTAILSIYNKYTSVNYNIYLYMYFKCLSILISVHVLQGERADHCEYIFNKEQCTAINLRGFARNSARNSNVAPNYKRVQLGL